MKRAGQYAQYIVIVVFAFLIRRLPFRVAQRIGGILGVVLKSLDKKHSALARTNLRLSFPEMSASAIENYVEGVFRNVGYSFMEFLYIPSLKGALLERTIKVEGEQNLRDALSRGRGVLMIIPHFGNWELTGIVFPRLVNCMAVAFPQSNPFTDRMINKYRSWNGLRIVHTGDAAKEILKTLKRNEGVGLLADQDAAFDGVFVDIFGRPAGTKRGPVVLALKTGAPLLMTFIVRNQDNTHTVVIEKELEMDRTGDLEADVKVNTQKWASMLESYVRKYPHLWFWVHNRWKSRPEEFIKSKSL